MVLSITSFYGFPAISPVRMISVLNFSAFVSQSMMGSEESIVASEYFCVFFFLSGCFDTRLPALTRQQQRQQVFYRRVARRFSKEVFCR